MYSGEIPQPEGYSADLADLAATHTELTLVTRARDANELLDKGHNPVLTLKISLYVSRLSTLRLPLEVPT